MYKTKLDQANTEKQWQLSNIDDEYLVHGTIFSISFIFFTTKFSLKSAFKHLFPQISLSQENIDLSLTLLFSLPQTLHKTLFEWILINPPFSNRGSSLGHLCLSG